MDTLINQLNNTQTEGSSLICVIPNGKTLSHQNDVHLYDVLYLEKKNKFWECLYQIDNGRAGKNGLTFNRHTNDGKTPIGLFNIPMGFAYKTLDSAIQIPMKTITDNSYWTGDDWGNLSNQWYEGEQLLGKDYEKLSEYKDVQYKKALFIDFNTHPFIEGKGNAIFLHLHGKGNTLGCVSIDEEMMDYILMHAQIGLKILIIDSIESIKKAVD